MDEKNIKASTNNTPPPSSQPAVTPQSNLPPPPVNSPIISRRRFLQGVVAASVVLAAASVGASGQILGPVIPKPLPPQVIANWYTLDQAYQSVKNDLSRNGVYDETKYSQTFYWPYDPSTSPYYKNVIARLPDKDPQGNDLVNPLYPSDPVLKHVVAFNTTCVHLRCLVNPLFYAGNPGPAEYRLQCPCHGSQYRLTDAVPVDGPAFYLGLKPLPQVQLSVDANGKISATGLIGEPGHGR